jgi:primary-amine oxidase
MNLPIAAPAIPTAKPQTINHPLEPLTAAEVASAVHILKDAGKVTPTTRFISVSLREPPKESVHQLDPKNPPPRQAFAVLFDNATNSCYEATLDLKAAKLTKHVHIPGAQPTMSIDEQIECEQAVLSSPEVKAALKKHCGTDDVSLLMADIWSAGNYGDADEQGQRLARPLLFLRKDPTDNGYARPIEGFRPLVDLNQMKVIRIEEYGSWPLPPGECNYAADRVPNQRTDIKALEIMQPEGPSFEVNGYQVKWQNWSFVIGFNAREGLTLHNLKYRDGKEERSVLYRASLTEMVVPYGDPAPSQRRKNAFDVGEYGMGMCANSLRLGCDCLGLIKYFDAHMCDSRGRPLTIENAICMHEEDFGVLWKHTDRRLPDKPEVRRSRRLVVSSFSTVENYEYGFFWYLYQDGTIQLEVKLTGILSLGAFQPGEQPRYGNLVAPQVYAPNHQHFFNVRLDFDLDGTANTVQQLDAVAEPEGPSNTYGNAFVAQATPLKSEKQARAHLKLETGRTWKIINPSRKNHVGVPVGYRFLPGDNAFPLAHPSAWWRKRARFVDYHVWVTPYHADEQFAAGNYPNQQAADGGLIRWTEQDRPIENTDVVLWYTMGHTHLPRPEDYPVMPTAYIGFTLKPSGFFNLNPANDVPPSKAKAAGGCCH